MGTGEVVQGVRQLPGESLAHLTGVLDLRDGDGLGEVQLRLDLADVSPDRPLAAAHASPDLVESSVPAGAVRPSRRWLPGLTRRLGASLGPPGGAGRFRRALVVVLISASIRTTVGHHAEVPRTRGRNFGAEFAGLGGESPGDRGAGASSQALFLGQNRPDSLDLAQWDGGRLAGDLDVADLPVLAQPFTAMRLTPSSRAARAWLTRPLCGIRSAYMAPPISRFRVTPWRGPGRSQTISGSAGEYDM